MMANLGVNGVFATANLPPGAWLAPSHTTANF
jgi:hypothetical protein